MTEMFDMHAPCADEALNEVAAEIKSLDPGGDRWAAVIRHTYDVIYNGQETGRYCWSQLMKTEKTHFGTLFEINAQREFEFDGGDSTDYRIAGHQVDAKWSQKFGGWMLPPEVFGELALVATGDDQKAVWSLGLIRVTADARRDSANRDKKSSLNRVGLSSVHWLWRDEPLPPNVLLQLDYSVVEEIFAHRSGTVRTVRLFREAEGRVVHRNSVSTVSEQLDAQRRVRGGKGGAREVLAEEGFVILSGTYHSDIAAGLNVSIPRRDEYISVKVVPTEDPAGVLIGGRRWRRALQGEKIYDRAPVVKDRKGRDAE